MDNSINELNEYLIYRKAIIINLNDEINNKDKNEQKKLDNAGITKNKFVKWA